ncbi:MAG: 4Fe-4S binding protein [Desulfobulbaceae bacterium]|nr:4Fe-4S binding protein [Desulfobulbaceae bacterium]
MIAELLFRTLDTQDKSGLIFNPKRCLRSRLNSNSCEICLTRCRKKALTLRERSIVFNKDQCTGCMVCVAECPNDAFTVSTDISFLLQEIHNTRARNPLVLSCHKSASHSDGRIPIPCIGLLSEPVLAALNCLAPSEFYLDVHQCADCENGHVLSLLHERIQTIVNKKGQSVDLKIRYLPVGDFTAPTPEQQRRDFLRMAKNSMIDLGKDATKAYNQDEKEPIKKEPAVKKDGVFVSRFLHQALRQLPGDAVQEKELLHSYFFTSRTTERCDLCPLCTGMCPTGALKRKTDGEIKQLSFTSSKCSGCGICVAFCRKNALEIMPGATIDPGVTQAIA